MKNSKENTQSIDINGLKKIRDEKKLTVEAVANEMKVSTAYVHKIESGEFEKLGAATFVRGHIINYCKVLDIVPDTILAQIPQQLLQHQALQTSDAAGSSPLSHVRRQSNHLGRYALGTSLLGMLGMSFYFIWDKWSLTDTNPEGVNLTISQNSIVSDDEKKITYSSLIPQVTGPKFNEVQNPGQVTNLSEANEVLSEIDLTEEENPAAVNANMDGLDVISAESAQQQSNLDANDSLLQSNTGDSVYTIIMEFEEQAWVSIKPLNGGSAVVEDLLGPGLREFRVNEPVHFRIGNANKMQLKINDDAVEINNMTNNDVADFEWPLEPNS